LNTAVTLLLPPALTLVLAFALHVFAKQRAQRVGLLPVALSILGCWAFIVRPGWVPVDDVRRVVHIAVGAALLGLALDALKPHRVITGVLVAGFLVGSAFASVTGIVVPKGPISVADGVATGALALVALLVIARFAAMRERALSLSVLLTVLALGLAVLAAIAGDETLRDLAMVLAAALAGYFLFVAFTGVSASEGLVLISGAPMLAMIWALARNYPDLRLALVCLPLVLFAEATALRIPLPAARISALLYPLILATLVSLPLVLAALIAFVTSGS
jgi:hypothetical protein